jgi:hypothetical protein
MDHDGRIARSDLTARAFGYRVRFELRIDRPARSRTVIPVTRPATPLVFDSLPVPAVQP